MDYFTRLRSLRIRNFRSFRDEQLIMLPETGLYLVRGENEDTDGSSGAGKTSFVKAISYAGGYEPVPASKLKCWSADGPMSVEAEFRSGNNVDVVKRGSKLQLISNGEMVKGDAKTLEFYVRDHLGGLPEDVMAAVTYRAQKQPGLFLSRPNGEKKGFLTMLLGLGEFEDAGETATKLAAGHHVATQGYENALVNNEAALLHLANVKYDVFDTAEAADALAKVNAEITEVKLKIDQGQATVSTMYTVLKKALASAEAEVVGAVRSVSVEHESALQRRPPFVLDDALLKKAEQGLMVNDGVIRQLEGVAYQRQKQINAEAAALEREIAQIEASVLGLKKLEEEQNRLAVQAKKIREDALCPTCERTWEYGPAKTMLDSLDEEFRTNEKIITRVVLGAAKLSDLRQDLGFKRLPLVDEPMLVEARQARAKLQQDLGALRAQMNQARAQYDATIREENAEFERRILAAKAADRSRTLTTQARPVIEQHEQTLASLRRRQDDLQCALADCQDKLQKLETSNRVNEALEKKRHEELGRYEAVVKSGRDGLVKATADEAAELDFAAMCKGFLTSIFNEVLVEIAAETNAILARVPNVAHITIQFEEKATGRGPQIDTVLFINGQEKGLEDLSGGMETAIDLAVDLAVSAVVARRTGGRMPGWLVLDEPFTGLDSVCKEACMEILKDAAKQRLILVVDHATEFKEMFSQFVTISYRAGTSRIAEFA